MVESTNPVARSAASSTASLEKFLHDRQVAEAKSLAILAVPGIAMAASRARQQSEARANEMLAQQQQMNHQLWIQNQLLSGRSMQDIEAQMAAERDAESRQRQAAEAENRAGGQAMFVLLLCVALSVFLAVVFSWVAPWPRFLLWGVIPSVLLFVIWSSMGQATAPAATEPTADEASPAPSQSTHEQWVDNFQAEHGRKREADPPPD